MIPTLRFSIDAIHYIPIRTSRGARYTLVTRIATPIIPPLVFYGQIGPYIYNMDDKFGEWVESMGVASGRG